ncbi:MAG TPA: M23 family metallopeptidase [Methylotenera sp.]|nr:M23 family metallopeptidase [Methylotenera sp.]HPH04749.1 M23 family metallopeptidase [Methylotenera sp.]HPN01165.1 M23 family metallopeptidase [Methylotenera sp.]
MQKNETNQSNNELNHLASNASRQNAILAQIANKTERKLKLRWILAISTLPLFGIFTAFGIAPQTVSYTPTAIVEEISLPSVQTTASNATQHFWYKERVRRDDTLNTLFSRLNVQSRDAIDFIRNDSVAKEIASSLRPGRAVQAQTDAEGNLIALDYQLSGEQFIVIKQVENGFEASKVLHPLENRPILKSAKIKSSLFGAADDANIPDDIVMQVAELFESHIDFNTDLRRGDQLNVIYEGNFDQGELINTGKIIAAEFTNNGKTYQAVGFKDASGEMQYYTPEGMSLHKTFLRTPLEFSRISSGFTMGRFHPILQRLKAHKGTDFAAPTGTAVKAAGDAVVDFVGVKGGYGNVVVLKHDNGVSTVYGHLSRFSANLQKGTKVAQGELIAYVGTTGLSTGPHLHYEFLVNGEHRDPMTVALPKDNALTGEAKVAFDAHSKLITAQLGLLSNSNMASLD